MWRSYSTSSQYWEFQNFVKSSSLFYQTTTLMHMKGRLSILAVSKKCSLCEGSVYNNCKLFINYINGITFDGYKNNHQKIKQRKYTNQSVCTHTHTHTHTNTLDKFLKLCFGNRYLIPALIKYYELQQS